MLSARLAARLGIGQQPVVIARLAGNADAVTAQRAALGAFGDLLDVPDGVWTDLRTSEPAEATVLRFPFGRVAVPRDPFWSRVVATLPVATPGGLRSAPPPTTRP